MKVDLYNLGNKKIGTTEVPDAVFAVPWKPALVKQVVEAQLANRRRPTAHAKGRGEVRGGGRKPWRQKGTGRARVGSIRSPIWRGGGKAHGPRKERDYAQGVNKKMKRIALLSVLSRKFKDGEVKIFDTLTIVSPKTKVLSERLNNFLTQKKSKKFDILLVPDEGNKHLYRAAANLPKTKALNPQSLNVYDLLNHKQVFIDERAVPIIERHYRT